MTTLPVTAIEPCTARFTAPLATSPKLQCCELLTAACGTFETSSDVRYMAAFRGNADISKSNQS